MPTQVAGFRVPPDGRAAGDIWESTVVFRFRDDAAALSDHLDGPVLLAGPEVGGLPLRSAESVEYTNQTDPTSRTRIVTYADRSGDYDPEEDPSFELQAMMLDEGGRDNERFVAPPYDFVVPGAVADWSGEGEGYGLIARVGSLVATIEASGRPTDPEWRAILTTIGTAPFIAVTARPGEKDTSSSARFEWNVAGGEPRTTRCKFDDAGFEPCVSGHEIVGLDIGRHSFEVQVETEGGIDTKRIDWTRV